MPSRRRFKEKAKPRCEGEVSNDSYMNPTTRCTYKGKVEIEGRWYCGLHDPSKKKKRDDRRERKWAARRKLDEAKRQLDEAQHDLLQYLDECAFPIGERSMAGLEARRETLRTRKAEHARALAVTQENETH